MSEPWVLVVGAVAVAVALGCLVVTLRTRRELAEVRRALAAVGSGGAVGAVGPGEDVPAAVPGEPQDNPDEQFSEETGFVITGLSDPSEPDGERAMESGPERIDGPLFADLVLRESVVRVASLAHGVRRALTPESRKRIRFEVKREVKRARKQRRADVRTAVREWEARQRNQERSQERSEPDQRRDEDAA